MDKSKELTTKQLTKHGWWIASFVHNDKGDLIDYEWMHDKFDFIVLRCMENEPEKSRLDGFDYYNVFSEEKLIELMENHK